MEIIYKKQNVALPKKHLSLQIEEGRITSNIRSHLERELLSIQEVKPNSWDVKFIKSMTTYQKELSLAQKKELKRILQNPILTEEHPNGIKF